MAIVIINLLPHNLIEVFTAIGNQWNEHERLIKWPLFKMSNSRSWPDPVFLSRTENRSIHWEKTHDRKKLVKVWWIRYALINWNCFTSLFHPLSSSFSSMRVLFFSFSEIDWMNGSENQFTWNRAKKNEQSIPSLFPRCEHLSTSSSQCN